MPAIDFTVVTDDGGFQSLEGDWRRLSDAVDPSHFFQTFDWCWHAWERVSSKVGRRLRILVGRVDDQVVLILPLMISGSFLRALGSDLFEFHDVLVLPDPQRNIWIEEALRAAQRLGGAALLLREIRQDADLAGFLSQQKTRGRSRTAEKTSILDLSQFADWHTYFETLPKQLKGDQRRQWRRLAELPKPARFEIVETGADQIDFIRWMHTEKTKWREAHDMPGDLFASDNYRDFLCSVVPALASQNKAMTCRIVSGTETLAGLLGFVYRGYFVFFMFAYDPKWSAYSPGRLVMAKAIEWCFEHQIKTFDMLVGGEDYKAIWSNSELPVGDYFVPLTAEGRMIDAWHGLGCSRLFARSWLNPVFRIVPGKLRQVVGGRLVAQRELIAEMRPL